MLLQNRKTVALEGRGAKRLATRSAGQSQRGEESYGGEIQATHAIYFADAHPSPSADGPASTSFSTAQSDNRITATFSLVSQETYATSPAGRISISCGEAGTSMVWVTFRAPRATTTT